jgi:hypothetical protein
LVVDRCRIVVFLNASVRKQEICRC